MLLRYLVTHGLMSRVFLMKWYHFSVEYFEDLRNINHCEFLIMNKQPSGKYVLENKLRTWSELRRERALKKEKEKEKGTPTGKDGNKLEKAIAATASPIVAPRRWGGCPNGCTHDKSFRIRSALADLVKRDGTSMHPSLTATPTPASAVPNSATSTASSATTHGIATPPTTNGTSTPSSSLGLGVRRQAARRFQSEDEDSSSDCGHADKGSSSIIKSRTPHIDVARAREEIVSSPDGTPSFISVDDRLRAQDMKSPPAHLLAARGRDFGGSYSGQNSLANSDADSSEDERRRLQRRKLLAGKTAMVSTAAAAAADPPAELKIVTEGLVNVHLDVGEDGIGAGKRDQSGMGRNTMANRLGDSPVSSESGCCEQHDHEDHADDEREKGGATDEADDLSDIDKEEREDKSIKGSVY